MAIDKAVDSSVLDTRLSAIADSIRAKGTTSAPLDFLNGDFETAIDEISINGGEKPADGFVVTARNSDGFATAVDFYGTSVPAWTFGNGYSDTLNYAWRYLESINCKDAVTLVGSNAFCRSNITAIPQPILDNCASFSGTFNFAYCTKITGEVEFKELTTWATNGDLGFFYKSTGITKLSFPKLESKLGQEVFAYMTALTEFYAPRCAGGSSDQGTRAAFGNDVNLQKVQLGSVGYPVTELYRNTFGGLSQSGLTITLYCTGSNVETFLANARNGAVNATIIIKASEDTTYNGTSYVAGATMITSTVEV